MSLNIYQICEMQYPGQIDIVNITFKEVDGQIVIDNWNVPGVERPSDADLLALADSLESEYWQNVFKQSGATVLQLTIDNTARQRQYDNGVSCASYISSGNAQWKAEAEAFIAWRDSVFSYAINIQEQIAANQIPVPTIQDFQAGIPVITWPN